MGMSLTEIAKKLKDSEKKVQLIYAFNGTGKTRLSREFRLLIDPKDFDGEESSDPKIIYYNAFTEDLFYWDNDLDNDTELKLNIQSNKFTNWILSEQEKEQNVIENFHHYSNTKVSPKFYKEFSEVRFSLSQDGNIINNIKISKGEESNFIWSIFFSLFEQIVEELKISDPTNRSTNIFDHLEYIFIDDPVSSLDDNHLIELAVNLAELIKKSDGLKFIISTHNPLFYNVLYNELGNKVCYMLEHYVDDTFDLVEKKGDSNKSFSYHLHLKYIIKQAIDQNRIQKYHFTLLRNLYEKTANFLGYPRWSELLPNDKTTYYNRIIQFTSHSTLSVETVAEPTEPEKKIVTFLFNHLVNNYSYWKETEADV